MAVKNACIGVDLGGTSIKYAAVDESGAVLWQGKKATEAQMATPHILQNIVTAIEEARAGVRDTGCEILGVGMGSPGVIDIHSGQVLGEANNLNGWNGLMLADAITEAVGLPVFIDNDANLMGLGEFSFGQNIRERQVLFVTIGTGIGGAIFMNGELYRGHRFAGGELGGLVMEYEGKVGYWEDFASTSALVARYQEKDGHSEESMDGYTIFQRYIKGEALASEVLLEQSRLIGMGLASLVNIFNPQRIIVGGGISEAGPIYLQLIEKAMLQYSMPTAVKDCILSAAEFGNQAGFLGAAEYARKRLNS
ncbi:ROK family protein [Membranihabitans marinus]|uniref:ROK family protein n=1 Tax=Membranihabitans marinus TaxID=1227546 RepID=UPI001F172FDB|nr:ROK family protein [Membranihabitans marinus]